MTKIKELNKSIRKLRAEIAELRRERNDFEQDRNIYRDYCVSNFKWFVKLIGNNQTPNLAYLIKEHTRLFNKTKRFYMELGE